MEGDLDGAAYPTSAIEVRYKIENPALPSAATLKSIPIELGVIGDAYVVPPSLERRRRLLLLDTGAEQPKLPQGFAPRAIETKNVTIEGLSDGTVRKLHESAIWAINDQLRSFLNRGGLIGVYAVPDEKDISPTDAADKRQAGNTKLGLVVYTGVVKDVRTVGSGDRVPTEARINNPIHARIREGSPVRPATGGQAAGKDLLQRSALDDYVFTLNRHPGRRVDVAVSALSVEEPGAVVLDYLVAEARPWSVFGQISNTGTKDTSEWRERFGFVHNQLTNRDDILTLDYVTAGFTESHFVNASYEAPLFRMNKLRWRVYGLYSNFTASDVGQAEQNFDGEQYEVGGELIANVYQKRDFFLDLFGGVRYERIRVNNRDIGQSGDADFLVPYIGLRAQRLTDAVSTLGELTLLGRFTDAGQTDLNALGRLNADDTAAVLQWQLSHSFFLEPLLYPEAFKAAKSTLAHELYFSLRGQYAFGSRLVPQAEDVIGGFYSVRGYEESVASGDTSVVATAEYRWHIPRGFATDVENQRVLTRWLGSETKPFRLAPQTAYARPDWDLIVRGFVDAGYTMNSDKLGFENNEGLVGVGVGVELQVRQNLSIRVDWGIPLQDVEGQDAGDSRVHFSLSLLL